MKMTFQMMHLILPEILIILSEFFLNDFPNDAVYQFDLINGGVQQCRSTTVPNNAGKFQNILNAFSKERQFTNAN